MNAKNGTTIVKRIVHRYLREYAVQTKEFLTQKKFRHEVNDMVNIVRSHLNKNFRSIDKNFEDIVYEIGNIIATVVGLFKKNIKLCIVINETFGLKPAKITVETLIILQTITYLILDKFLSEWDISTNNCEKC